MMEVAQLDHLRSPSEGVESSKKGSRSSPDSDESTPVRLTHTLTACCRCRQHKSKCDPNLPKCLKCERAGQKCEYWDPTKRQKVPRHYVLRLMDQVKSLEAELNKVIDEDGPPVDAESLLRPGAIISLHDKDTAPRYLGPSSGVAITKLVMEEAKRYMDTRSISDLMPKLKIREEEETRATPSASDLKQSYPIISAVSAKELPTRRVADNLMRVFNEKAQVLWPTLHEPSFANDLEDVYNGTTDFYKNFIVRMVFAISLQKGHDLQYAGLADSFYLAAIENLEEVIKLRDLRTLQCLVLIAQYSLVSPTKTAIYYIVGLAARLCQQLGLTKEATIGGVGLQHYNPLEVDMRRRLHWIVLSMEFGLAHSLGRPNAFSTGRDHIDVAFFDAAEDVNITAGGITEGPKSIKKAVAIHFFKMRLIQSDIRKVLYQKKRETPQDSQDPWFSSIQTAMDEWHKNCPSEAKDIGPWFKHRYNTMLVFLNRPSPQIPEPSPRQALICYEASASIIDLQARGSDEVTWVFVVTTHMVLNTLLWTLSYHEVRNAHAKEEAQEKIECGISVLNRSLERWPSHSAAPDHYSRLAKAIFRSYEFESIAPSSSDTSLASALDRESPHFDQANATAGSARTLHAYESISSYPRPTFSDDVFGSPHSKNTSRDGSQDYTRPTSIQNKPMPPPKTPFRSGSIFEKPGSLRADRRPSSFPPEVPQLPDWGQMSLPPTSSQNFMQQITAPGPQSFPTLAMYQSQSTRPRRHVLPRDMGPSPAHLISRNNTSYFPSRVQHRPGFPTGQVPLGQQHALPSASNVPPVPRRPDEDLMVPAQVLQAPSRTFDWDTQGNPFTQDYEMHDRMGSLSEEQQGELMQRLEVDGLASFNMNAVWQSSAGAYDYTPR